MAVTEVHREILGIACIVVQTVVEDDGEAIEDSENWYAQDSEGNVWCFGRRSRKFEDGKVVNLDGSWTAGVDGAEPSMCMPADPRAGDTFDEKLILGDGQRTIEVLDLTGSETVPAVSCSDDCLITEDITFLDSAVIKTRYFTPGVGLILEVDPDTGERVELVEVYAD